MEIRKPYFQTDGLFLFQVIHKMFYYLNSLFFSVLWREREEERKQKGNEQLFENTGMEYTIGKSQQNAQGQVLLCDMQSRVCGIWQA